MAAEISDWPGRLALQKKKKKVVQDDDDNNLQFPKID
jgi:hypothetical protein